MKKLVMFLMVLVLFGCKEQDEEIVDDTYTIVSVDDFVVDGFSTNQLDKSRPVVYMYYDIVGYADKEMKQPIYAYVPSALQYEIGEELKVATVEKYGIEHRVIMVGEQLDTSWFTFL